MTQRISVLHQRNHKNKHNLQQHERASRHEKIQMNLFWIITTNKANYLEEGWGDRSEYVACWRNFKHTQLIQLIIVRVLTQACLWSPGATELWQHWGKREPLQIKLEMQMSIKEWSFKASASRGISHHTFLKLCVIVWAVLKQMMQFSGISSQKMHRWLIRSASKLPFKRPFTAIKVVGW